MLAILVISLSLRLIELNAPLIDQQAWRQTDTAAIARNYFQEGYSLLYPRVDWRGDTPGYVEMNFPLYPFAVALLYGLAGEPAPWLGRLLAALCSVVSVALLYSLVRRFFDDALTARLAAAIYALLPLSWFFGRAFMPEALMMALSIGALLAWDRWLRRGGAAAFCLAAAVAALCFLVKIPTLYLGLPLVAIIWDQRGWRFLRQPLPWLYLVLVLVPSAAWYTHAAALFDQTGLTFGIWGREGYDKWDPALLGTGQFYRTMASRFVHIVATPAGFLLSVAGLVLLVRRRAAGLRRHTFLLAWLAALFVYLLLVPEGNRKLHYYQLPFTPVLAQLMALALVTLVRATGWPSRFRWGSAALLLALVVVASAAAVRDYYRPGNNVYLYYASALAAGRVADRVLPHTARLVVGDLDDNSEAPYRSQNPSLLYYAGRKGWQITPDQFEPQVIEALVDRGATHFIGASRFVMKHPRMWRYLLDLGVSTPRSYPHEFHSQAELMAQVRRETGLDRHFLLAGLISPPPR